MGPQNLKIVFHIEDMKTKETVVSKSQVILRIEDWCGELEIKEILEAAFIAIRKTSAPKVVEFAESKALVA